MTTVSVTCQSSTSSAGTFTSSQRMRGWREMREERREAESDKKTTAVVIVFQRYVNGTGHIWEWREKDKGTEGERDGE